VTTAAPASLDSDGASPMLERTMVGSKSGTRLLLDSVKSRIIVFALFATLVPALVTGWLFYVQNLRSLHDTIARQLDSSSSQAAREADLWLKERLYELRVFASSYVVSEALADAPAHAPAAGRLHDYLHSVQQRFADYGQFAVVDLAGVAVASSTRTPTPPTLPDGWQARALAGEAAIGPPHWDAARHSGAVVVVQPIFGGEPPRLLGALVATLELGGVAAILAEHGRGGEVDLYLVDGAGAMIVGSLPLPGEFMAHRLPVDAIGAMNAEQGRPVAYAGAHGPAVVGAIRRLPRLGWGVVAEQEREQAFAGIVRLRNLTAGLVGALLLAVGLVAYVLAQSIVRPLGRLTGGAARVAGGDLEVALPEAGRGELGVLTDSFNRMVARLRASHAELHELSITDSLTGLANRKHLMETLEAELERFRRYRRPLAVAMVDIDHFKRFNDSFGHLAGDAVLRRLADTFRASLRGSDFAGRYGGEEFLLVLPETEASTAVEIAERIRARVAGPVSGDAAAERGITVSVGVAEAVEDDDLESLIRSADTALYRAKQEGRDRVSRFEA